jgi:hypothetical protein
MITVRKGCDVEMTRDLARQFFRELRLSGEIYRGCMLIGLSRREWRIPLINRMRFWSRQDARKWIDAWLA